MGRMFIGDLSEPLLGFAVLAAAVVFGMLTVLSLLVADGRVGLSHRALAWMLVFACILLVAVVLLLLRNLLLR